MRFSTLLLFLVALCGCASDDYAILLVNDTLTEFEAWPVVTGNGPPARQHVVANDIAPGASRSLDVDSFNPLFYAPTSDYQKNTLFLGFGFGDDPAVVQYQVLHYTVPLDQLGGGASQPLVLDSQLITVPKGATTIRVTEDWTVLIE